MSFGNFQNKGTGLKGKPVTNHPQLPVTTITETYNVHVSVYCKQVILALFNLHTILPRLNFVQRGENIRGRLILSTCLQNVHVCR